MASPAQRESREPPIGSAMVGEWVLASGLVLVAMALRFWRLGESAVLGDESYYWLWSKHLALCYLDNPGGVAWQTWLGTLLGGNSEFGLRWLNALLGASSVGLMYGLGRRLFSGKAGLLSAAFLAAGAPYLVVSRFVYTDALPIFLLLLNLNQLASVFRPGLSQPRSLSRWVGIGLTWMLLLNTKVSVYPYGLGLALGILAWRRDLLRHRCFWAAVAIGGLGILPWMLWNAAHSWAGLEWMWQHATQGTFVTIGSLAAIQHIVRYLSPGLLLFISLGFLLWREREGQWLILLALPQLLPVALSPANSPRNLLVGCLPLLAAAGAWATSARGRFPGRRLLVAGVLWLLAALVGLGTVVALFRETRLPQSSVARVIRQDRTGMRELGSALRSVGEDELVFAVDYGLASQLWFHSGRPVYTSWGQYQLWGVPDFDAATVLSLGYVANELVTERMAQAFHRWDGPTIIHLSDGGMEKWVYLWHGEGLQVPKALLVQSLDLFVLDRAAKVQTP